MAVNPEELAARDLATIAAEREQNKAAENAAIEAAIYNAANGEATRQAASAMAAHVRIKKARKKREQQEQQAASSKPQQPQKKKPGRHKATTRILRSYFLTEEAYNEALQVFRQYAKGAARAKAVVLYLQEARPESFRNDSDELKSLFDAIVRVVGKLGQYRGFTQKDHISDKEREKLKKLFAEAK